MAVNAPPVYKFKAIPATTAGDLEVVAAVTGKRIAVHGFVLCNGGTTAAMQARFESAAGGTALTGVMNIGTATVPQSIIAPFSPVAWCMTDSGAASEALSLEITGATGSISGVVIYSEVPDPAQ